MRPSGIGLSTTTRVPPMNPWKLFLERLAGSNLIAKWRLTNGAAWFMMPPPVEKIGDRGFNTPGPVHFSELLTIVVRANQPLGALAKSNDLAAVRSCLPVHGLSASDHGDRIEVRVNDGGAH